MNKPWTSYPVSITGGIASGIFSTFWDPHSFETAHYPTPGTLIKVNPHTRSLMLWTPEDLQPLLRGDTMQFHLKNELAPDEILMYLRAQKYVVFERWGMTETVRTAWLFEFLCHEQKLYHMVDQKILFGNFGPLSTYSFINNDEFDPPCFPECFEIVSTNSQQ